MEYKRLKENIGILNTHNATLIRVRDLTHGNKTEHELIREIVSDCREILDKIEQGTLIELPCKEGDIVYCVGSKCLSGLYDKKCIVRLKDECPCILNEELIVFEKIVQQSLLIHLAFEDNDNFLLGKTVFLTREEAEKRLKELQE